MIKIENLCKKYGDLILFENVSLVFKEGKKILIKGINGSGKSVFLKLLVGYASITKGKIFIDNMELGKDVDYIPLSGVSINAPEFCNNMSGLDNLIYLAKIRNIATIEDIYSIAKKLDFDQYLTKKYKDYSLGMKQKMRIIQALMEKPKYLILDEPFDALDQKSQKQVIELLNQFVNEDNLLIFTSHNLEHENFADSIYEINDFNLLKVK